MESLFDVGVACQEVYPPRQGVGSGFRSGEEERDDLIDDLAAKADRIGYQVRTVMKLYDLARKSH
jgi:hypothetical protein